MIMIFEIISNQCVTVMSLLNTARGILHFNKFLFLKLNCNVTNTTLK